MHGEAVAIGMMVAARVARLLGACRDDLVELHREVIRRYALPTASPAHVATADVLDALRCNKRYLAEGTRMALLAGVGAVWRVDGEYMVPVSEHVLCRAFEATKMEKNTWHSESPSSPARALA
jgi:3-dehydroquinate synthetase